MAFFRPLLQVRTNEAVDSKRATNGTRIQFTVIRDVNFDGVLAIPRGATVRGAVTEIKRSGEFGGSSELALQLISLDLGGQNYPLQSDLFNVKGPNKAGKTARNIFGGALLGALLLALAMPPPWSAGLWIAAPVRPSALPRAPVRARRFQRPLLGQAPGFPLRPWSTSV